VCVDGNHAFCTAIFDFNTAFWHRSVALVHFPLIDGDALRPRSSGGVADSPEGHHGLPSAAGHTADVTKLEGTFFAADTKLSSAIAQLSALGDSWRLLASAEGGRYRVHPYAISLKITRNHPIRFRSNDRPRRVQNPTILPPPCTVCSPACSWIRIWLGIGAYLHCVHTTAANADLPPPPKDVGDALFSVPRKIDQPLIAATMRFLRGIGGDLPDSASLVGTAAEYVQKEWAGSRKGRSRWADVRLVNFDPYIRALAAMFCSVQRGCRSIGSDSDNVLEKCCCRPLSPWTTLKPP
jgi:hypothetical protein